jgi:BCD family chlorophyll transporter-like MFS transporter
MQLAGRGRERREGTRMGLWGAAQAIAAGMGGLLGTALVDIMRTATTDATAFGTVFAIEAALFVLAAAMAVRATAQLTPVPGE